MKTTLVNQFISAPVTEKMPVLFIGHGSPMNAIEKNDFTGSWSQLGKELPKPRAILCISAHWETNGTLVTAMETPPTIHDFGGFQRALYEVEYPAPGSPELATSTRDHIKKTTIGLDYKWGLDHGTWSVLKHFYPQADIPIIQMSLDYNQSPQYHYELAKEISWLRERGVMIVGSGNIVHNLRLIAWDRVQDPEYGFDWAITANEKIKLLIENNQHKELIQYPSLGKEVQMAVPSPDHYLPLLYILSIKNANEQVSFFNDKAVMGSLTMTSLRIG